MTAVVEARERLRDTDGFRVETAEGWLGWVEEIWLGEADEPRALAVQTIDGTRALLPAEEVLSVDREQRWVVVPPQPTLLELAPPHLTGGSLDESGAPPAASWTATGALVTVPEPRARPWRSRGLPRSRPAAAARERGRPLWQTVALLYGSLALIVVVLVAVVFLVARLVTGAAY